MRYNEITRDILKTKKEDQWYDRKSARIKPDALAHHLVAFANADGGTLVIGVEDDFKITGINDYTENVNELKNVGISYCNPSVLADFHEIDIVDDKGNPNKVLVIDIPMSKRLHATNKDEVYLRVGDKSRLLSFEDRLRMLYAKGEMFFEDKPVYNSSIEDIDFDAVKEYCGLIGYAKTPEEYIKENNNFLANDRGEMSSAAILLFAKNPQKYFKRAYVRFIRFEGIEEKSGTSLNVIKDRIFEGRILEQLNKAIDFVRDQLKERTFLGSDGLFKTVYEYPEFAWKELIVNAVCHRDYSILGTDIQIKMFDDHITVESPGNLAGNVRVENIRNTHFSRNPIIARYLKEHKFVKEFGEGIGRICADMEEAGLEDPIFKDNDFMFRATIRNANYNNHVTQDVTQDVTQSDLEIIIEIIRNNPKATRKEMAKAIGKTERTVQRIIQDSGKAVYIGHGFSGHWEIIK